MRIKWIQLDNFRCFAAQRVDLHPELTLLFGENGTGKSAVVAGLAAVLRAVPGTTGNGAPTSRDLHITADTGAGQARATQAADLSIKAAVVYEGSERRPAAALTRGRETLDTHPKKSSLFREISNRAEKGQPLPVVAVYRADRTFGDVRPPERDEPPGDPFVGYREALDAGASLAGLRGWWRHQDHRRRARYPVPALDAVELAVARVTRALVDPGDAPEPGEAHLPAYDTEEEDVIMAVPGQGHFTLRQLSDGYRGVLAMVADIARRAAQLHPAPGDDLLDVTTGVVVIDEVDLHLHPGWQHRVVPALRATFPGIQFVVTTHSVLVLGSVASNDEVRRLTQQGVEEGGFFKSKDANAGLREMGVPERNREGDRLLGQLRQAVDDGDLDAAEGHLRRLRDLWGPHHPDRVQVSF